MRVHYLSYRCNRSKRYIVKSKVGSRRWHAGQWTALCCFELKVQVHTHLTWYLPQAQVKVWPTSVGFKNGSPHGHTGDNGAVSTFFGELFSVDESVDKFLLSSLPFSSSNVAFGGASLSASCWFSKSLFWCVVSIRAGVLDKSFCSNFSAYASNSISDSSMLSWYVDSSLSFSLGCWSIAGLDGGFSWLLALTVVVYFSFVGVSSSLIGDITAMGQFIRTCPNFLNKKHCAGWPAYSTRKTIMSSLTVRAIGLAFKSSVFTRYNRLPSAIPCLSRSSFVSWTFPWCRSIAAMMREFGKRPGIQCAFMSVNSESTSRANSTPWWPRRATASCFAWDTVWHVTSTSPPLLSIILSMRVIGNLILVNKS